LTEFGRPTRDGYPAAESELRKQGRIFMIESDAVKALRDSGVQIFQR
jgi:hypothetical protein